MVLKLDDKISFVKDYFEGLTREQQVERLQIAQHINSNKEAMSLLKGVKCKEVKKKAKKTKDGL